MQVMPSDVPTLTQWWGLHGQRNLRSMPVVTQLMAGSAVPDRSSRLGAGHETDFNPQKKFKPKHPQRCLRWVTGEFRCIVRETRTQKGLHQDMWMDGTYRSLGYYAMLTGKQLADLQRIILPFSGSRTIRPCFRHSSETLVSIYE